MKLCRSLIGAAAIAGLLAFATPASAQRHGHGGGGWHGHPGGGWHGHGWGWGGPRVAFAVGVPFWGWGYPYAPYGYGYYPGYYPYGYAPVYAQPQVYEGHVVSRRHAVDAKDVQSQDE